MHPRGHGAVVAGTIAVMVLAFFAVFSAASATYGFVSLAMFIAGVGALVRDRAARNRDIPVPLLLLMLLAQPVFTNLRIGAPYLIVFALFAGAAALLLKGRDRIAGLCLAVASLLAIAVTPFIDPGMRWTRPAIPALSFVGSLLLIAAATVVTVVLAKNAARSEPWVAAAAALSALSLPGVGESPFVLLAIPLALLRLNSLEILVIGGLLIVPLDYTAERSTTGWSAWLAYPRVYAAWLLWAASIRELRYHAPTQEAGNGIFTSRVRS